MKKNILYIFIMTFFIMSCEDEIISEIEKPHIVVSKSQYGGYREPGLVKIKVELSDNYGHCSIDSITIKYGTSPSNLTSTLTNEDYYNYHNEYDCYFDENGTYFFKVIAICNYSNNINIFDFESNFTLESDVMVATVANVPANEGAVDLGLSVKWAACNLGATKSYEQGILSVWGNPSIYFNANFEGDTTIAIEDCGGVNPPLCISGTELDIATTQLGGDWRLPTKAEAQELLDSCKRIHTRHHGIEGDLVIGPNGNSIFLPYESHYNHLMTGSLEYSLGDYFTYAILPDYPSYYALRLRNDFYSIRPVQGELK